MAQKHRGFIRIRWFRRNVAWGTVYLTCDETYPRRVKLGFTQRKTVERRQELARSVSGRLAIVQTVRMPHAFALEARCHRAMKRLARRDTERSREWYILRDGIALDDVLRMMKRRAERLRLVATLKIAWPRYGTVTVFDSGWRPATVTQPWSPEGGRANPNTPRAEVDE